MNKKKILIVLAILFGAFLVLIVALPFVIDVDKYRPEIVQMANEKINGKLQIGKMQLSLWGQIKVNVDGIELDDAKGEKILSVKDVYFHIPFTSLLSGSPLITLKLTEPEIRVIKDKQGKMNALGVVKTEAKSPVPVAQTEEKKNATPPSTTSSNEPPSFVKKARFGLEIRKATLSYKDTLQNLDSTTTDLNFLIKDFSMERPSQIEFWATLDTKMGKVLNLSGPVKATAKITPQFKASEFESAKVEFSASMDDVQISMPEVFEKKKGVPAHLSGELSATQTSVDIQKMECVFFNAKIEGKAQAKDWDKEGTLALDIRSNEIELAPWGELLPQLKEHELSGSANFNMTAKGKMDLPQYALEANLKDFKAKNPKLKVTPVIKGHLKVVTDKVEDLSFLLEAPGNHLEGKGTVENFKKPRVNFTLTSRGLDLDSFMDLKTAQESKSAPANPAKSTAETKTTAAKGTDSSPKEAAATAPAGAEDMDILLEPLRQNEIAKNTVMNIKANIASLKAYDVKMTDLSAAMSMKNLSLSIDNAAVKMWDGEMKGKMAMELLPKTPTYNFNFNVARLNIQKAVESRFALFKNTLLGNANFSMSGNGQSFTTLKAKKNLNAKGNLDIRDATFATVDIVKVVSEGITKIVAEKVPAAKNQKVNVSDNTQSKYTSVTSDFAIANGVFTAPNFFAKAEPSKGIDVKGNTQMGILDYALKANWELIDTYNVTHARDLTVEQNGIRVEHILAEGNEPVKMPILVEGTAMDPKISYTTAIEALSRVALKNIGNAVGERAKLEAKKQLEEAAQKAVKQASPQIQDAVKNLGGKLFGN